MDLEENMFDKKKAQKYLIEEIQKLPQLSGFKYSKKICRFYKSNDTGCNCIVFSFISKSDYLLPEFFLTKRWDIVENIYFRVLEKINLKKIEIIDESIYTILQSSQPFDFDKRDEKKMLYGVEMSLKSDSDVTDFNERFMKYITDCAVPFFETNVNLEHIDKIMNGDTLWETDWMFDKVNNYMLGGGTAGFEYKRTIIAHLCGNKRIKDIQNLHINIWENAKDKYPKCEKLLIGYNYLFEILKNIEPLY